MSDLLVAPVVLPAVLAPLVLLFLRHDVLLQRVFTLAGTVALAAVALWLFVAAMPGEIAVYRLGDWPAPFGIVLVLDRLAALMLVLTAFLSLAVLLYAYGTGWDVRGTHFHALFLFQLMGLNGAFLTGDAFNLFVFFEVLLIASYGLMIHGGGRERLKAGVQYVVMNLAGSTLFLFALGTLYAVTGTLNMADLAVKVATLPAGDAALLRVAGVLLLIVFGLKAALVPLQFWLPGTYANAPGPVAALFAVMTKVGAYAILRLYTLVFPPGTEATGALFADLLQPAALLTLTFGMVGVLGSASLSRIAAFAAIGSMGTLFLALAQFTPEALSAALYYLLHSTLAGALLFLVADMVIERRGAAGGRLVPAPPIRQGGPIAALYFATAVGVAGMPPLSGFLGKLLVLRATGAGPDWVLIWSVILVTSLIAILGLARAGSVIFWKTAGEPAENGTPHTLPFVAAFGLLAGLVALSVFAGPAARFLDATAAQLSDQAAYAAAVLGQGG